MNKDFKSETYTVDDNMADTMTWLMHHQEVFDSLHFDVHTQENCQFHMQQAWILFESACI